ncbi:hypothetical protein [Kitasatospora sp. NPDC001683]
MTTINARRRDRRTRSRTAAGTAHPNPPGQPQRPTGNLDRQLAAARTQLAADQARTDPLRALCSG